MTWVSLWEGSSPFVWFCVFLTLVLGSYALTSRRGIVTVVGSGVRGDGCPSAAGLSAALKFSMTCDPKTAMLRYPRGLAIDSSTNLYILDGGNHVVRKVSGFDAGTSLFSTFATFAGSGRVEHAKGWGGFGALLSGSWKVRNEELGLIGASGLAIDNHDNLFVVDTQGNRILELPTRDDTGEKNPLIYPLHITGRP